MIFQKVFIVTLNIVDPVNFCTDKKNHALVMLEQFYVKRCYQGVYIISIVDILQMSNCYIVKTNNTGHGYIHVEFNAKVSIIGKWEIIPGMKIMNFKKILVGESINENEPCIITLLASREGINALRVGQIIPVRVFKIDYSPFQQQPTASAVILTCERSALTYEIQSGFSEDDITTMKDILSDIHKIYEERKSLDEKSVEFFTNLFCAYGNHKTGNDDVDISTMLTSPTAVWTRSLNLSRDSLFITRSAGQAILGGSEVFIQYLLTVKQFAAVINHMAEFYLNKENYENVWFVIQAAQLSNIKSDSS